MNWSSAGSMALHTVSVCLKRAWESDMLRNHNFMLVLAALLAALISKSCSAEKQIASSFVSTPEKPALLITHPGFIYKSNLKKDQFIGLDAMAPESRDSALFFNSLYLKELDDSVIFENFLSNLMGELVSLGYEVYSQQNLDAFLATKKKSYIFDIAQMELEEYILPHKEREVFDDTAVYFKSFDLNAVNMNTWFELAELNPDTQNRVVLYASHYVFDYLKGRFIRNTLTGEVKYRYVQKPMATEDVYKLASVLGKKYAGYLNDYLLNRYIASQLPEGSGPERYYHFDTKTKRLVPANAERFQILEGGLFD
jgi:hypothetical protein